MNSILTSYIETTQLVISRLLRYPSSDVPPRTISPQHPISVHRMKFFGCPYCVCVKPRTSWSDVLS